MLLVFTKPAVPGRVKTRLIAALGAGRAARLHAAFLADLLDRLRPLPAVEVRLAWALEPGEPIPPSELPAVRQEGHDLGERLHHALAAALRDAPWAAAVGSDHPTLPTERVEEAAAALAAGAPVVLGPAADGGYYLIGVRRDALSPRLFAGVPWSGPRVLEATLERCRELALEPRLLPPGADVDTPADLERLARELAGPGAGGCPRTRELLGEWGLLPSPFPS